MGRSYLEQAPEVLDPFFPLATLQPPGTHNAIGNKKDEQHINGTRYQHGAFTDPAAQTKIEKAEHQCAE